MTQLCMQVRWQPCSSENFPTPDLTSRPTTVAEPPKPQSMCVTTFPYVIATSGPAILQPVAGQWFCAFEVVMNAHRRFNSVLFVHWDNKLVVPLLPASTLTVYKVVTGPLALNSYFTTWFNPTHSAKQAAYRPPGLRGQPYNYKLVSAALALR